MPRLRPQRSCDECDEPYELAFKHGDEWVHVCRTHYITHHAWDETDQPDKEQ